jgi:hypothetical protein
MYDVIGDIHGQVDHLRALLNTLNFREQAGVFRHPKRRVIFLGDFIDGGDHSREVVDIVRRMVDEGSALAVMGNHEFNAIAYGTPDPEVPRQFLRPHTEKNLRQHEKFLTQFSADHEAYADCLDWFRSLPLYLELDGLRVIHASWCEHSLRTVRPQLTGDGRLTPELTVAASRKGSDAYYAVETLLKGAEVELPAGRGFVDSYGHRRSRVRVKWWESPRKRAFEELVLGPPQAIEAARGVSAPAWPVEPYAVHEPPLFVGHYWLNGALAPVAENVACLDYSVARGGRLAAYRWDGEQELSSEKMLSVQL